MAKVKPSGKANTVELIPTMGVLDSINKNVFAKCGWALEYVTCRGQGGIGSKKEHYNERTEICELSGGRVLEIPMKDRKYSMFRTLQIEGRDIADFREWMDAHYPYFTCSLTILRIRHKKTGVRLSCRVVGRMTKNILAKKLIVHMINGRKVRSTDVPKLVKLLGDLTYNLCSYDYSAGKRNVICDS